MLDAEQRLSATVSAAADPIACARHSVLADGNLARPHYVATGDRYVLGTSNLIRRWPSEPNRQHKLRVSSPRSSREFIASQPDR